MLSYPGNEPNAAIPPPNRQTMTTQIPNYGSMSPSGLRQTRLIGVPMFDFNLSYEMMKSNEIRSLQAFFLQTGGPEKSFSYIDILKSNPVGNPGASVPMVNGAGQIGDVLSTAGWEFDRDGLLVAGDIFTINNDLKVYTVTKKVTSNDLGIADINIEPSLLISPLNLELLTIYNVSFNCNFTISNLSVDTFYPYFSSLSIRFSESI